MDHEKVNILLVDDQPAKLLAYEVILKDLGQNLVIASSGREALEVLLKTEIAVILVDVCMPELDGFELAAMIREHPRFQKTAMIFISAIQVSDIDRLRGYEMGAVDYVPVPVVPEVLRAKVKVFAELYRKTRELERLNQDLEDRVRARTAELENSTAKLRESEERRSMAIAAGKMGSWDWDWITGDWMWDEGQYRIFGVGPESFEVNPANVQALLHPDDVDQLRKAIAEFNKGTRSYETEFRIVRPDGDVRWCVGTAAATVDDSGRVMRVSGVTVDITERKRAEERQTLLAREVDHRAKNALALAQSIVRLTRADEVKAYVSAVEGRINALARVHTILSLSSWQGAELSKLIDEELAPYSLGGQIKLAGSEVQLLPATAQTLALALHELFTKLGEIWRALDADGTARNRLAGRGRAAHADLGGIRRPARHDAEIPRLWYAEPACERRVPARRAGAIRLARRGSAVPARGAVGPQDCRDDRARQLRSRQLRRIAARFRLTGGRTLPALRRLRLARDPSFEPGFCLGEIAQSLGIAARRASLRAAGQLARFAEDVRSGITISQRAIEKDHLTHIECSRVARSFSPTRHERRMKRTMTIPSCGWNRRVSQALHARLG
ncbi:PAS domain S-box-containing protein [Bradyrhizobium sp. GM7.3]